MNYNTENAPELTEDEFKDLVADLCWWIAFDDPDTVTLSTRFVKRLLECCISTFGEGS